MSGHRHFHPMQEQAPREAIQASRDSVRGARCGTLALRGTGVMLALSAAYDVVTHGPNQDNEVLMTVGVGTVLASIYKRDGIFRNKREAAAERANHLQKLVDTHYTQSGAADQKTTDS